MKKITMKTLTSHINNSEFKEHLTPVQLTLFKEHKLSEKEREIVFEHLAQCKRCREVLKIASELEQKETPINNPNYMGTLKHFIPFAAAVVIFLGVPQGAKFFTEGVSTKSVINEKNIFEESIEYWEELLEKLFKGIK